MNTSKGFSLPGFLTMVVLSAALVFAAPTQAYALSGWSSSYSSGVSRAKSSSKPLLVVVAQDGCPACAALESNLVRSSGALKSAVRVRVAADRNPALASRFAGAGTPTILVFSSQNGYSAPVYSYTGVMSSGELRQLGRSLDRLASSSRK